MNICKPLSMRKWASVYSVSVCCTLQCWDSPVGLSIKTVSSPGCCCWHWTHQTVSQHRQQLPAWTTAWGTAQYTGLSLRFKTLKFIKTRSIIIDVSVSIRDRNVARVRIIGCFDELFIWNVHQPDESVHWGVSVCYLRRISDCSGT